MTPEDRETQEECDCCGFVGAELNIYRSSPGAMDGGKDRRFCELCASTMTSTHAQYAHRQGDALEAMKTICYVGNAILLALRKGGR